jgi:predicted DNA-binding protein
MQTKRSHRAGYRCSIGVALTLDQDARLRRLAEERGLTPSAVGREAIERHLNACESQREQGEPKCHS